MSRLQKLLWAAKRPVALVGGSRWSEHACAALARFAERFALPVATTFRRGHLFDALHPCYAGDFGIGPNPKLLARVKGADLVLLIGGRMSEMPSQSYTLFDIPEPQMKLVHVHPGAEELGRVYHPASRDQRGADRVLRGAGRLAAAERDRLARRGGHRACRLSRLGREGDAACRAPSISARSWSGCARICPPDAILTNGAGNFAGWIHRFYRFRKFGGLVGADLRLHGLWLSGGAGDEDAASRSRRGVHCRRRRLPDDGAGFRHRRAIRTAGDRRDRRQRSLRHHPHAPGARISRPRDRHRTAQSRISSPMPWRSAASARWWRRPPISRPPLPPRRRPASRRSSISRSIRKRSRRPRRLPASARRRWRAAAAKAGRIASSDPRRHRPGDGRLLVRLHLRRESSFTRSHALSPHRERGPPAGRARAGDP